MNPETLKALNESIEHHISCRDYREIAYYGVSNCALCRLFFTTHGREDCCKGCPIFEKTGKQYCLETPYYVLKTELEVPQTTSRHDRLDLDSIAYYKQYISDEKFRELAQKEIDFLVSLKPKEVCHCENEE